jgi:hypothetical protein
VKDLEGWHTTKQRDGRRPMEAAEVAESSLEEMNQILTQAISAALASPTATAAAHDINSDPQTMNQNSSASIVAMPISSSSSSSSSLRIQKLNSLPQSPENMKSFRRTIIQEAVRQMRLHHNYRNIFKICSEDSNEFSLFGLSEIEKLCREDDEMLTMSLVSSGILTEFITSLLPTRDHIIQEEILNILCLLSSTESTARALLSSLSSISHLSNLLVEMVSSARHSDLIQEAAMFIFMSLCGVDDSETVTLDHTSLSLLLHLIQQSPNTSTPTGSAVDLRTADCSSPDSVDSVGLKCKEFIAGALVHLSRRSVYHQHILSSDFLPYCCTIFHSETPNSPVTYQFLIHLLTILFHLSLAEENKTLIGESGLIPVLLHILKLEKQDQPSSFHLDKPAILEITAAILLSLSNKLSNKRKILADLSTLKLLLEYLEITYPLALRTNIIGILVNLSTNDQAQKYLVAHSGLFVYVNSLKAISSYQTAALLSSPMTSALLSFSASPLLQSTAERADSLVLSSSASSDLPPSTSLSSHPNYQLLLQYLSRILTAFIRLLSLRYHRDLMTHLGLVPRLCSLLHSPFRQPIKLLVTSLMLALTEDKENLYAFTSQDLTGVVTLLSLFKDTQPVSSGILILENTTGCLLNIISSIPSTKSFLITQGAIPHLVRLLPIIPSQGQVPSLQGPVVNFSAGGNKSTGTSTILSELQHELLHQSISVNLENNQFTQQSLLSSLSLEERDGGGYMTLAENSAETLRLLIAVSLDIRSELISLGALPLLLRLIDHGSFLAKESALGILLSLVYHEELIPPVMQLPFVPSLVQIARNSKGFHRIKELIVETFYYLSQAEELRGYLGREDAITPLVMLMKYGSSVQIKHLSLETLVLLAEEYENKHLIGEKPGFILVLISYMRGGSGGRGSTGEAEGLSAISSHSMVSATVSETKEMNERRGGDDSGELLLEMKEMAATLLRSLADDPDCRNLMRKAHLTPQSILYHGVW